MEKYKNLKKDLKTNFVNFATVNDKKIEKKTKIYGNQITELT